MIHRVIDFLNAIGIPAFLRRGSDGFVPMVAISHGTLFVDPAAQVSDVLHEAGHLAVIPDRFRMHAEDDIDAAVAGMFRILAAEGCEIDSLLMRAALQSGEQEATAWAWAAGLHLGIPALQLVAPSDYGGRGDSVRLALELRQHAGINGLQHAEMCDRRQFPQMLRWTQIAGNDPADSTCRYPLLRIHN